VSICQHAEIAKKLIFCLFSNKIRYMTVTKGAEGQPKGAVLLKTDKIFKK
jgi:hypothetical protein